MRFAFVEKINSTLVAGQRLFASPDLDETVLTAMAYRLGRQIKTQPITANAVHEAFLAPLDISLPPGVEGQFIALSEIDKVWLLVMLPEKPKP